MVHWTIRRREGGGRISHYVVGLEKREDIWLSPKVKAPLPTENVKHIQTLTITWLHNDYGPSVGVGTSDSHPIGVVKPVYGIPTFTLTAKAVKE